MSFTCIDSANKTGRRRFFGAATGLVTLGLLFSGCASTVPDSNETGSPAKLQSLVVGNGSGLVSEPYVLWAESRGFFGEDIMQVDNTPGGSSAERVAALVGGSVDVMSMSVSDLFLAAANAGFEATIVAGGYGVSPEQIQDALSLPEYDGTLILETALVVTPGLDVSNLGNLDSLKIGVRSPSASTTLGLQIFISENYTNPPRLELTPFKNQNDSLSALLAGDVDGSLLSGAIAHQAISEGMKLVTYPLAYWAESGPYTLWVTTPETAEKKETELLLFREAMLRVAQELNEPESLAPFREFLKSEYQLSDEALDRTTIPPLVEEEFGFSDLAWVSRRLLDSGQINEAVTQDSIEFLVR